MDNVIKLNTNENPYPPAPKAYEAAKAFDMDKLRLYPDPECSALVHSIAQYYGMDDNEVFTGVGSDDVLAMCFMTFFNSEKPILFPDISYSFYSVWADLYRIPYETPALNDKFEIVPEDYFKENGGTRNALLEQYVKDMMPEEQFFKEWDAEWWRDMNQYAEEQGIDITDWEKVEPIA